TRAEARCDFIQPAEVPRAIGPLQDGLRPLLEEPAVVGWLLPPGSASRPLAFVQEEDVMIAMIVGFSAAEFSQADDRRSTNGTGLGIEPRRPVTLLEPPAFVVADR